MTEDKKDKGVVRIKATIRGNPDDAKDITLPLWNKDETDVLPAYQLTYGHAVCQTPMTAEGVKQLAEYLGLGPMDYVGDFDADRLPSVSGHRTLGTEQEAHLLVAAVDDHYVIFGPHKLFFNSRRWTDWNKDAGGLMAYVTQLDVSGFFYSVFGNGQLLLSASAEGDSVRYLEEPRIEAYLNGKRIYHEPGGKPEPTEEIDALLASDARITEEDGVISVRTFPSNQPVERLTHYVFRKPQEGEPQPDKEQRSKPQRKWYSLWAR